MGGVDRCDQLRGNYSVEAAIKTGFWYKKCFFGILGITVANAYIIWREGGERASKKYAHSLFMQELFQSLVGAPREEARAHTTPAPPTVPPRLGCRKTPATTPSAVERKTQRSSVCTARPSA
jgi:hypothetical protein